jgi:hypothetical protein
MAGRVVAEVCDTDVYSRCKGLSNVVLTDGRSV